MIRTHKRTVRRNFTKEDVKSMKTKIGELDYEIMDIELEVEEVKRPIKALKRDKISLFAKIQLGYEHVEMEVVEEKDFMRNVVTFIDPDTGDVVGERELVEADKQEELV